MKWKIGDKFTDKCGEEWTVLAKTVGGEKIWVGKLLQVLDTSEGTDNYTQWKYINRMLIDADYDGDPNNDVVKGGFPTD